MNSRVSRELSRHGRWSQAWRNLRLSSLPRWNHWACRQCIPQRGWSRRIPWVCMSPSPSLRPWFPTGFSRHRCEGRAQRTRNCTSGRPGTNTCVTLAISRNSTAAYLQCRYRDSSLRAARCHRWCYWLTLRHEVSGNRLPIAWWMSWLVENRAQITFYVGQKYAHHVRDTVGPRYTLWVNLTIDCSVAQPCENSSLTFWRLTTHIWVVPHR